MIALVIGGFPTSFVWDVFLRDWAAITHRPEVHLICRMAVVTPDFM